MGTRNLTIVIADGERRVAQYGQWDGYPEGQGATALEFLRGMDEAKFRERLKDVKFRADEWWRQRWLEAGADPASNFVNMGVVAVFDKANPYHSRDHGAEILEMIQKSTGPVDLSDSWAFAADSLMCEWAYVIDLDKRTFEVYRGFNHSPTPAGERFADMPLRDYHGDIYQYYPIKHVVTFSIDALPTNEDFVKTAHPPESDEADEAA